MLKKYFVAACCALAVTSPTWAETIETQINNKTVYLHHAPFHRDGQVLVPLKELVCELGGTVHFDPIAGDWTAIRKDRVVTYDLVSPVVTFNGELENVPSYAVGDELMVPLSFASRVLGTDVRYDRINDRVAIDPGPVTIPGMTTPVAYTPEALVSRHFLNLSDSAPPVLETHLMTVPLTERVPQSDLDIAFLDLAPRLQRDAVKVVGVTQPDAKVSVKTVRFGNYSKLNNGEFTTTADATGRFEVSVNTEKVPDDSILQLTVQAEDSVGNRGPIQRLEVAPR